MANPIHVVVTGSHGLIGSALVAELLHAGHRVTRLVRSPAAQGEASWDPLKGTIDSAALDGADADVHLAGAGIGDKKWTEDRKKEILDSRVKGTTLLAGAIADLERKPAVLASGSAIGIYGDRGDEALDEHSTVGSGFLADLVAQWEASTASAERAGVRVAHLRTGLVLSTKGGILAKQLLPFKLGVGGRVGPGRQVLPWITLRDEVAAIVHVLAASSMSGPINLTAPNPVTNLEFTKALGKALRRPTILPVPLFALKVLFGPEMVREALLSGARVLPKALLNSGFQFRDPDLAGALRTLFDTKG